MGNTGFESSVQDPCDLGIRGPPPRVRDPVAVTELRRAKNELTHDLIVLDPI